MGALNTGNLKIAKLDRQTVSQVRRQLKKCKHTVEIAGWPDHLYKNIVISL